jgi:hypothetical protein
MATYNGKPMPLTRALVTAGLSQSQACFVIYRIRKGDDLRAALKTNRHLVNPSRITITSLPAPRKRRYLT